MFVVVVDVAQIDRGILHMLQLFQRHDFECFRCFSGMLQVFQMDVAKLDRDVAYIAMVVHVCCKDLFPMFHLFF